MNEKLQFILTEILFWGFMAMLVYVWWIRPHMERKSQEKMLANMKIRDIVELYNGQIGILNKIGEDGVTVVSGKNRAQYKVPLEHVRYDHSLLAREGRERKIYAQLKEIYK
jgi:preprotein translocase subunit YajC